jgi:hypothetical protein
VQRLLSGLLVLGLAFTLGVAAPGCKKGTANNAAPGDVTYDLDVTEITIKQGESKEVTVTRKGKDLKDQEVNAMPSAAAVKATPEKFKGDKTTTKVTIAANEDAEAKTHTVKIKVGTFEKDVKVTVEEKKGKKGKGGNGEPKVKYMLEKDEVTLKPGDKVTVKISRKGKELKDQALTAKSDDEKVVPKVENFKGEETDATLTITADPKIGPGKATITIKAGEDKVGEVNVKVEKGEGKKGGKGGKEGRLNGTRGRDLARAGQIEALPAPRVSLRREVALFTRE